MKTFRELPPGIIEDWASLFGPELGQKFKQKIEGNLDLPATKRRVVEFAFEVLGMDKLKNNENRPTSLNH